MKIKSLAVYQTDLPLVDGDYCWADGKSVSVYDSTVIIITTDTGLQGVGEVVPLGPNYLASYARGVRTGIEARGGGERVLLFPCSRSWDPSYLVRTPPSSLSSTASWTTT